MSQSWDLPDINNALPAKHGIRRHNTFREHFLYIFVDAISKIRDPFLLLQTKRKPIFWLLIARKVTNACSIFEKFLIQITLSEFLNFPFLYRALPMIYIWYFLWKIVHFVFVVWMLLKWFARKGHHGTLMTTTGLFSSLKLESSSFRIRRRRNISLHYNAFPASAKTVQGNTKWRLIFCSP